MMKRFGFCFSLALSLLASGWLDASIFAQDAMEKRILFYGRDSSVGYMKQYESKFNVRLDSFDHEDAAAGYTDAYHADLIVFLWGFRGGRNAGFLGSDEIREKFSQFLIDAKREQPGLGLVASASAYRGIARSLPGLPETGLIEKDSKIDSYLTVGLDSSNLERLLTYLAVTYLDREGSVEEPLGDVVSSGIYHPDHGSMFRDVGAYLHDAKKRGLDTKQASRVMVLALSTHFAVRNRQGIDALVRELERRGALCLTYVAGGDIPYERIAEEFSPLVMLDTRHRRGDPDVREALNIPFMQCMWLSRLSVDEWRESPMSGRSVLGLTNAELAGSIEPHVISGKADTGGPDIFVPIQERIERVAERAMAWVRLARKENAEKMVAMFCGPLEGGTPDNKLLNVPRSLSAVLKRMKAEGYALDAVSLDAAYLADEWKKRQIDSASPGELRRLVQSGGAALVPVEDYERWFETKVPEIRRNEVVECFGAPPGDWHVWSDGRGRRYFVVPIFVLGNVLIVSSGGLPPSGDESFEHVRKRMHSDKPFAPSHNILATAFWLDETYDADALIYWGSFSLDLLLPEKVVGLSGSDWPDIIMGATPNIRPFSLSATTFAMPARRRSKAVLVNHLTPPLEEGGLADELLTLSDDIVKWDSLDEGPLKERFRATITRQVSAAHLQRDLNLDLESDRPMTGNDLDVGRLMTGDEIRTAAAYLNELHGERISTTSHVLGKAPPEDLLVSQIVACAGKRFIDALGEAIEAPPEQSRLPGDRTRFLRSKAEEIVQLMVREGFDFREALIVAQGNTHNKKEEKLPAELEQACDLIKELRAGYAQTHHEIDHIVRALDGGFVPPGPANPPERNPSALPTGRNTYFLDPESIPSQASWDLGKELVDRLLAKKLEENNGEYPRKIAVSVMTKTTMMDFGVSESQILYLIGMRPVWNRNRVSDVELIPSKELGRPRIDVFVETKHHYNDYLESRAQLIDRAIRMVCELDEPDNYLYENRSQIQAALREEGLSRDRAEMLAKARIFAVSPGRFGSGIHDVLFESTGLWETREQLVEVYMAQHDFVYTMGCWGEKAPETYKRQLEGTDMVLRSLGKHGALTGRASYSGGNLCLAIEILTAKAPDYFIADLRIPGDASIERAEDLLRKDFRSILFNRKWIEGMKGEGANGAARIAALTWKALAWKINREGSVSDDVWAGIVDTYIDDKKNLNMREFFETTHPGAMQEIAKNLLDAVRKDYWRADPATVVELAVTLAQSVIRHGREIDRNDRLDRFVEGTLLAQGSSELDDLLARFKSAAIVDAVPAPEAVAAADATEKSDKMNTISDSVKEYVTGKELAPQNPESGVPKTTGSDKTNWDDNNSEATNILGWVIAGAAVILLALGIAFRRGAI